MSRGLRVLGLKFGGDYDAPVYPEFAALARALAPPTATHSIESILTDIGNESDPHANGTVCHIWDFLEIPPLKNLALDIFDSVQCLLTQIEVLKSYFRRRAQQGLPPLQTLEFCRLPTCPSLEPVVAAIAEVSPTTAVKDELFPDE